MQWRNNSKPSASASMHARFSVVESNQFRELTHLALNLNIGTDKSVRLYLSSRLSQTMMESKSIHSLYIEQQRRSDATESELISSNKRLQEVTQSSETEKSQIRYHAEEQHQTDHTRHLAQINEIKSLKDMEIQALREQSEKNRAILENKIKLLEDTNAKIIAKKIASDNENENLNTKLSYLETTNKTVTNELNSLREQLQQISREKASTEKSLHKLELHLSSLEYSNNNQEKTISQTQARRISAEELSADANQTLSRQQTQMVDLRKNLEKAELETSKYKDLTSRYQADRVHMKKNLKAKAEMIREQEEVLITRDKETSDLKQRVQGLEKNLHRVHSENELQEKELNDARMQGIDDRKKLDNNQQASTTIRVFLLTATSLMFAHIFICYFFYGRSLRGSTSRQISRPRDLGHRVLEHSGKEPQLTLLQRRTFQRLLMQVAKQTQHYLDMCRMQPQLKLQRRTEDHMLHPKLVSQLLVYHSSKSRSFTRCQLHFTGIEFSTYI